jgi:hypothetical protein
MISFKRELDSLKRQDSCLNGVGISYYVFSIFAIFLNNFKKNQLFTHYFIYSLFNHFLKNIDWMIFFYKGAFMSTAKSSTQSSPLMSLLHFLGLSLLASVGVSIVLVGIVLLLSSAG